MISESSLRLAAVKAVMDVAPALEAALESAAEQVLGRVKGPSQASGPLAPAPRQELGALRRAAKSPPNGSPKHDIHAKSNNVSVG